eukprot:CAMPEP_0168370428 /NCGR_PEP_ID=MMETSP0228-20121227/7260_1 /TAXON_ID=133427 /ORGANISM="Protoceratium reticulatum, Strain CCCM 535 (=CCMP 1889)" /LENGTH=904 /DNA_ID=CAMNT_0008383303 /DNA_START=54 /DNA_END=2768 /DNA_ORIENTATION=+
MELLFRQQGAPDAWTEIEALQAELTALAQNSVAAAVKGIQRDLAGLPAQLSAAVAARMDHGEKTDVLEGPPALAMSFRAGTVRPMPQQVKPQRGDRDSHVDLDPLRLALRPAFTQELNAGTNIEKVPTDGTWGLYTPYPELIVDTGSSFMMQFSDNGVTRQSGSRVRIASEEGPLNTSSHGLSFFYVDPTSWKRVVVDLIGLLLVIYDCIMVPLKLSWGLQPDGVLLVLTWVSLIFWTLDMMLGFVTGCFVGGKLITDVKRISRHYLQTYFLPDIIAIIADVAELLPEDVLTEGGERLMIFYFVRVIKLGKLVRLRRILASSNLGLLFGPAIQRLAQATDMTTHTPFLVMIPKIIAILALLVHVVACVWYGLAGDIIHGPTFDGLQSYPAALYWVVSTTFGGSSAVIPQSSLQAALTVGYILASTLFLACITSALAAEMIDAQMRRQEHRVKLRMLRQYLRQRKVSPAMAVNVHNQVVERMSTERPLSSQDVQVLSLLSRKLRANLYSELYAPILIRGQTIVRACHTVDKDFVQELCLSAVSDVSAAPGELLFRSDQAVRRALVPLTGQLQYQRDAPSIDTGTVCHEVRSEQWVCELALWVEWRTHGVLEALRASELVAVSAPDLFKVLHRKPELMLLASNFSARLSSELRTEASPDLSDVEPGLDADAVLAVLPTKQRRLISEPVLDDLAQSATGLARLFGRGREGLAKLQEEVRDGKCHLTQDASGATLRVVQLVAVRLRREDGRVCMEIGQLDSNSRLLEPVFKLPAVKVQSGEQLEDAMQRLVRTRFPDQQDIQVGACAEVVVSLSDSSKYGVRTKYVRRVYHAELIATTVSQAMRLVHRSSSSSSLSNALGDSEIFLMGNSLFAWMGLHQVERLSQGRGVDEAFRWLADMNFQEFSSLV